MKKYQVVGGQYARCWYGESDSLQAAKVLATKCVEYWDNRLGWHFPLIYLSDDCVLMADYVFHSGKEVPFPVGLAYMCKYDGRWVKL